MVVSKLQLKVDCDGPSFAAGSTMKTVVDTDSLRSSQSIWLEECGDHPDYALLTESTEKIWNGDEFRHQQRQQPVEGACWKIPAKHCAGLFTAVLGWSEIVCTMC